MKYEKVEIIDCTTAKLSHKCSDSCKREKHIIDFSNQKYDTIDKTSNVMKCKEDKKERGTEPDLSAIFFNNAHDDPPKDSYNVAKVVMVKIGDEQICSFETFIDIMSVEAKYLIIKGAREVLEEILDNVNILSTKPTETNIFPVFERLMKESSRRFMKDLLKTAVTITKSK